MARRRSLRARLARLAGLAAAILVVTSALPVLVFRWVPVPMTSLMVQDRLGALFSGERGYRFSHDWVGRSDISRNMAVAVIASEDQKFAWHHGFDFESIDEALTAAQRGGRLRGASTISQQVAKNLFLWPGQNWVRKGLEAWFTVLIEAMWPKRRILEVYLDSAEFGRGTWGVEAASRRFFHKPARRLTPGEAALLAAVLPNPHRFRVDAPSAYLRERQAWILGQMDSIGGGSYLDDMGGWPGR